MYGCIRRATNHERRPDHRHHPLGLGCRRRIDRAPPQPGSADKFAARRRARLHQYRAARCARRDRLGLYRRRHPAGNHHRLARTGLRLAGRPHRRDRGRRHAGWSGDRLFNWGRGLEERRGRGARRQCLPLGHGVAGDEVSMTAPLQFKDVTLGYDRHPAVHHLSGEIAPGALLAVVGPNGAGKSTLFRGIVGILKPLAGAIMTGGLDSRDIAYLPQSVDVDRSFPISVYDFVGTGLWRSTGFFGGMGNGASDRIARALAAVGLNGFENRAIGTLSGGQMQRMLFARVLLQDARLIVLDEPFNSIDARTSVDLIGLVRRWHAEKRTVLAALHDMDVVRANFPQTLLLARGPVAWGSTSEVLTAENLLEARQMCEAFDETAGACAVDDLPSRAA